MAVTLYDKKTGAPVQVPEEQVQQAYQSGQFDASADTRIPVVLKDGRTGTVPVTAFGDALATGARVATVDEAAKHEAEVAKEAADKERHEKYGGIGGQLAAAGINAADALTLGLGTGIAGAVGGEGVKQYIKGVTEENPVASGIGTGIGLIAPALLTGGASLAEEGAGEGLGLLGQGARALAAPTEALGALGDVGATGAKALLGEGTLGKIGGGVAKGVLEGGAIGAGQTWSESELGDTDLTAEKLLAGAAKGATFGGVLGGGLSALGVGAEKAASKVGDLMEGTSLGEMAAGKAEEMRLTSTGAKAPELKKIEASGLTKNEVGRWMLDDMPTFSADGKAPITREGIVEATERAKADAGDKIGASIDQVDATGAKIDPTKILDRIQKEVVDPISDKIGQSAAANKLKGIAEDITRRLTDDPSFASLQTARQELDELVYKGRKVLDESNVAKETRAARAILEDELGSQGEAVMGPEWKANYDAAKRQYRMAATVQQATEGAEARLAGNRTVSLSDTIMASHGLGALAAGHPLGLLTGLGGAVVNHLLREYGDAIGSQLLDKASKLGEIGKAADMFSGDMQKAVGSFINTAHAGAVGGMVKLANYKSKRDEIKQLATNPDLLTAHLAAGMPDHQVAPKLAATFSGKAANAIQYLNSTAPQDVNTRSIFTPQLNNPPDPFAQADWLKKVAVYENPLSVVHNMKAGKLSVGEVDALKVMYPKLYTEIQKTILDQVTDKAAKGKQPPYSARLQMGILFGVATDATMDPNFIAMAQQGYKPPPPSAGNSTLSTRAPATLAKMELHGQKQLTTEAQETEQGRTSEI